MEGRLVKELRARLGLSQERFARLLEVSFQSVRRWEAGVSRPLPLIALRLEELRRQLEAEDEKGGASMKERRSKPGKGIGGGGAAGGHRRTPRGGGEVYPPGAKGGHSGAPRREGRQEIPQGAPPPLPGQPGALLLQERGPGDRAGKGLVKMDQALTLRVAEALAKDVGR